MAMGIVSDSDFDKELSRISPERNEESKSVKNPVITGEVIDVSRGRGEGSTSVPDGLRKIIGEESAINGRQSAIELASQFGLSPSSVSAYANGATSTASYDRTPNKPFVNDAKIRVSKRARGKLMLALSKITGEKLDGTNARDLASIAKDMSAVVKVMEPETPKSPNGDGEGKGPTFIIYSPQFRDERHFETVVVKE